MAMSGAAALLVAMFLATWRLSVKLDNYSFVDVTWAMSFAPVAIGYAFVGEGWMPRRLAIGAVVAVWSFRLGLHLWQRVAAHHPKEDPRYVVLRQRWSDRLASAFLNFFLAQAVLVWLLMLPVLLICQNTTPQLEWPEMAGLLVWVIGLLGEGISDAQLSRFKRENRDPKAICQTGLWNYSRHPNYFFQSLLWWALFLIALPSPWGWTSIVAPVAMLYFLLKVTGIPLTENLAVEKRGDTYREYQRTTSAFVPWFKKV